MPVCLECGATFELIKPNQRFCPGGRCRSRYHNREKTQGLPLTMKLREGLRELATAHEITENEMACRMLDKMMNPDKKPIEVVEHYEPALQEPRL